MIDLKEEIAANVTNRIYFHGTISLRSALAILKEGFKCYFFEDGSYEGYSTILGVGSYLSCNWRVTVIFGTYIFQTTLEGATKILDISKPYDPKIIRSLKKEFGHDITDSGNVEKVLPRNKHLKLDELTALTRYHYYRVWEHRPLKEFWTKKQERHLSALDSCISILKRIGYHGFGDPSDENGIVIFTPERIIVQKLIAHVPYDGRGKLLDSGELDKLSLEEFKIRFPIGPLDTLKDRASEMEREL